MDLKTLCELNGASGDERAVRRAILEAVKPLCDTVRIDRMGNVIAHKKGRVGGKHLMFSAHMDEIGFIIIDATEDGLLEFRPVGGIDPRVAVSKYVLVGEKRIKGVIGALAIHLQSAEDRKRVLGFDHLYIDIGAKNKEDALADCPRGSYAYYDNDYQEFGEGCVVAKALDDRVGCYTMLRLLKGAYDADITCAFVTQEEVGLRGATGAAFDTDADTVIVLEGTTAGDMGNVPKAQRVCEPGLGIVISFMDRASIANRELYRQLMDLAQEKGIPHQVKRGATGGNDAGAYQRRKEGKRTCVLSVPCRYIHGPSSVVKLSDVEAQYALAKAFAEQF
ncbi:MAG: M20/M25/M40 family metallo-hydrolase [Clostridia bacterium]|nr:M20/M25/M40 family metallo-hydrolase [Clostridia bacterium]